MTLQPTEKQAEQAWHDFMDLAWEATLASKQDCFELFTLEQRSAIKTDLLEEVPSFGQLPFEQANTILVVLGFGALREGAKAYASLAYPAGAPLNATQVSYEILVEMADQTARPDSDAQASLRQEMARLTLIDTLVGTAAQMLLTTLVEKFEFLAEHSERLKRIVLTNLVHGIRLEYLLGQLIEQERVEKQHLASLVRHLTAHPGDLEPQVLAHLKKKMAKVDSGNPWPTDLNCLCGEPLAASISCCSAPIDPGSFVADLSGTYLLKTNCCGATLTGFRCGMCGAFHSWAKGIVASHT